ncbi:MAG: putative glycoside hydrolase/deacetylase ChbG (UPF0249 family) [Crocinitomicaceae bacterium]|jgi:predicted glycoside hydrolase/deacetylase ChbG (UPF0249 family)
MANVIFTADDYGFCDHIDEAILEAVEKGQINSVAAFANGPDSLVRLGKLKKLQEKPNIQLDIGCHLTITSGRPLHEDTFNDELQFVDGNRFFRSYGNLGRPNNKTTEVATQLKKEILKQLEVFELAKIKVAHLSSHHNALTFLPEYFIPFLEVASEKKIAVRSYNIEPELRDVLYNWQVRVRLRVDEGMKGNDVSAMRKYMKDLERWYSLKELEYRDKFFPNSPIAINGANYGPIPPRKVGMNTWKMRSRNKAKKLLKSVNKLDPGEVTEYVFHLGDPKQGTDYSFETESSSNYYPGVQSSYFHGRYMEFKSLDYHLDKVENKKFHKRWNIKKLPVLTAWNKLD